MTPFAELRTNGNVAVSLELEPGAGVLAAAMDDVRQVAEAHPGTAPRMRELQAQRPPLPVVRLTGRGAVDAWLEGPLARYAS